MDTMWKCSRCGERVDDNFDECWNCGASREGEMNPAFKSAVVGVGDNSTCNHCGYLLRRLTGDRCPECGEYIDRITRDTPEEGGVDPEIAEKYSGQPLCLRCAHPINPLSPLYCEQCGTPQGTAANTDPMASIYAQGDGFNNAINRPDKPIVLVGMWLLFAPAVIVSFWFIAMSLGDLLFGNDRQRVVGTWHPVANTAVVSPSAVASIVITALFVVLYLAMLIRMTMNWRRASRDDPPDAMRPTDQQPRNTATTRHRGE